jgi:colanic acid/amylovoran biosynthesis protein
MKILFLGATFETSNMGVSVLTDGVICTALHQYPPAALGLLDYGTENKSYTFTYDGRTSNIPLINMRFSKNPFLKNHVAYLLFLALFLRLLPFSWLKRVVLGKNFVLSQIETADIVGAISGGDSFSDIYGYHRFFYIALPMLLVILLKKKLLLLPQTFGPFKGVIARQIARWIIERATKVYSRDHIGKDYIQKALRLNIKEKIEFRYDVGFILPVESPQKISITGGEYSAKEGVTTVGINISGLLYSGGYTGNNMFGLKVDYKKFSELLIELFVKKESTRVLLVPHVFGRKGKESDTIACETVFKQLKERYRERLLLVEGSYTHRGIKYIIGTCDFFIGSRMHACIAALSLGIPTISIAYSDKFFGVMQSIGFENLVADPRSEDEQAIINKVDFAFKERLKIAQSVKDKMANVKKEVLRLFRDT